MRLSVIVCAYNMARELPRTLHTMSTSYQTGVEEGDYEIIVVDNGSAPPVDEHALRSIAGNVHVRTVQVPNRSPAPALNAAVAQARGEMIGLFIDGARHALAGHFWHGARHTPVRSRLRRRHHGVSPRSRCADGVGSKWVRPGRRGSASGNGSVENRWLLAVRYIGSGRFLARGLVRLHRRKQRRLHGA